MSKVQDTPSFLLLHRFSSSDYAELTEHSCFTDYARNLNGFGLAAIGLRLSVPVLGGIATTARSSFRLKSVSNPRKAVKVPLIPRNPMNNDTPSFFVSLSKYLYLRLTVCVFPVMVVTTALPLARTSAFSYLASTITLPFKVMIPQCLGICSKAQ